MKIPLIGCGTWELRGDSGRKVVETALDVGYRHIDTALAYENHKDIGRAIRGFDREQLFITSKLSLGVGAGPLSVSHIDFSNIETSVYETCQRTLDELGIDYLDLMLIHWPDRTKPMAEILGALRKFSKVRYVGVSNFNEHYLQDMYDAGQKVDCNQVEFHPYLYQRPLQSFCEKNGTRLAAYRPFGKGALPKEEPLFAEIGNKYGKTPNQIILRWITQKGIPVIAKASSRAHLEENFNCLDFSLSDEDEKKIDALNKNKRYSEKYWADFKY